MLHDPSLKVQLKEWVYRALPDLAWSMQRPGGIPAICSASNRQWSLPLFSEFPCPSEERAKGLLFPLYHLVATVYNLNLLNEVLIIVVPI